MIRELTSAVLLLSSAQGLDGQLQAHTAPLRDYVQLTLSTESRDVHLGEVVALTLKARNVSTVPISAYLSLDPKTRGGAHLEVRHGAGAFTPLQDLAHGRHAYPVTGPVVLDPGDERTVSFTVGLEVYAEVGRKFLFDRPATHDLRVVYDDTPGDPNGILESNILSIRVTPPPSTDEGEYASYSPDLAYVALFDSRRSFVPEPLMLAAARFVKQFGGGTYAKSVREGLYDALTRKMEQGDATAAEQAAFEEVFDGVEDIRVPRARKP